MPIMFCSACATSISDGAFCPKCGAPLTRVSSTLGDEPSKKLSKVSILVVALILLALAAWTFPYRENEPADKIRQPTTSYIGPGSAAEKVTMVPELKINSAGRLPLTLQRFKLGMSVADALNTDSSLEYWDISKGKPSAEDTSPSTILVVKTYDGYFIELFFANGRLIRIRSDLSDISPQDADQFDSNTESELGKPDVVGYRGPDAKSWTWIDGDVRANFADQADSSSQARSVRFELVVYSLYLKSLADDRTPAANVLEKKWVIHDYREEMDDLQQNIVVKHLPRNLDNLRLGMAPWEIRNLVPGIDISSMSQHYSRGWLSTDAGTTDIKFWDQAAYSLCEERPDAQSKNYEELRSTVIDQFGTPISDARLPTYESLEWDDGTLDVSYTISSQSGDKTEVTRCVTDKHGKALEQSESSSEASYKAAPRIRSFF